MEIDEIGTGNGKSNDPFIDRSKVRILLCDNDSKSAQEVFELLCKCSYQVTSVRSARQVIDALNAEGPDIDIILSEVDLPTKKGLKLLKYIMRDKQLQRIPVIMMSTQDEVSLVVKCLRLGAADYLVKPLRTNELLNLWTHMWRRRQMLGLAEKNIMNYDFDIVVSDPSDANTNSTTLFSDDTDDRSRKNVNPEISMSVVSVRQEEEPNKAISEPRPADSVHCQPESQPGMPDRRTDFTPFQKRSGLKIGQCSAFFTYVKANTVQNSCQAMPDVVEAIATQPSRIADKPEITWNSEPTQNGDTRYENGEAWENYSHSHGEEFPSSTSIPDSTSMERSCTPPISLELMPNKSNDEGLSQAQVHPRNGSHFDASGVSPHAATYPYYMPPGMMNHMMMSSSAPQHMYPKDPQDHNMSAMIPHYNHFPHCPSHLPGMGPPFGYYYPVGLCVQQGQHQQPHPSSNPHHHQMAPFGNSPSGEATTKLGKVDRREAALMKFRQKRKERCFDKKIRYVNRKKLAERRPRVRGQFVRKVNGVAVDLNGDPSPADLDEEDEDEDEDDPSCSRDSEDDAS